jgi:DNA topoisomerase-1
MNPAVYDQTTVEIDAGDYQFRSSGNVLKFRGFLQAYEETTEETNGKGEEDAEGRIPEDLHVGETLRLNQILPDQHFTKPPGRYTESSLIKELDALGIGRPSTYASIIATIVARNYVERNERRLNPTELGFTVSRILVKQFPDIFNVEFTARMEDELDKIEEGEISYLQVLKDFYGPFTEDLTKFSDQSQEIKESLQEDSEHVCENCGKPMIIKWGRNGRFYACTGYPECKTTKPLESEVLPATNEICEKCGGPMVVKMGRFGRFLACSNYPACKNTHALTTGMKCPKCGTGKVVEKKTRRGKIFFGCSNYNKELKCEFASWDKPIEQECPSCGNNYLVEKYSQAKRNYLKCPQCKAEFNTDKQPLVQEEAV